MGLRCAVLVVAMLAAGCGQTSSEAEDASGQGAPISEGATDTPAAQDPGTIPTPAPASCRPTLTVHDCATQQGYRVATYTKPDPRGPELIVLGIYESRSDHGYGYHPTGEATVQVRRTSPHVLVLSSYEPTRWTLDIAPGAKLEGVILNGYHAQTLASVPAGLRVVDRSGVGNYLSACAYKWPDDNQGCNTAGLMEGLKLEAQREVTDFAGCYRANRFTVEDAAGSCNPQPPPPGPGGPVKHEAACTAGQGTLSTYVAQAPAASELHLLGVYESNSDHRYGSHPEGTATVEVTRKAPLILALSSYEPIHWTVKAVAGARIERIVLNGFYPQRVTAPEGIPVDNRSGYERWLGAYAYAWPASSGGSDTPKLVSALESLTGRPLTSFAGCYQSTGFKLGE